MSGTCVVCRHPKRDKIEQGMANGTPLRDLETAFGPSRSALSRHRVCRDREERKREREAEAEAPADKKSPRSSYPEPSTVVAPKAIVEANAVEVPHTPASPAPEVPAVRAGSRKLPYGIADRDDLFRILDRRNQGRVSRADSDSFWDYCMENGWPVQIGVAFSIWRCPPAAAAPRRESPRPPPAVERESSWPRLPRPDGTSEAVRIVQERTRGPQGSPNANAGPHEPHPDHLLVEREDGSRPPDRPHGERSLGSRIGMLF